MIKSPVFYPKDNKHVNKWSERVESKGNVKRDVGGTLRRVERGGTLKAINRFHYQ